VKSTIAAALGYSYLRFSSTSQADGDSVRRQTALRESWLKRHPDVRLDTSLTLVDAGVSGYRGKHRTEKRHALAQFLDLVERGRVPAGSFLIVENLDRLTREEPEVSIPLVMNLIRAGVKVVQLAPTEMVYEPGMDFGKLMMMLWELARGHAESKRKSGLCGEAWMAKKEQARKDKTPYGAQCPAWLELANGEYRVKADAARAVRKIFEWSAAGLGALRILERLNGEGVPPIGKSGAWERSYVCKILRSRTVLGEYQPHKGSRQRQPEGEPVPGFYPAVIGERLWNAAQAAAQARQRRSGRPATAALNPFSGLLHSATDGEKLHVTGSRGRKYLVSAAAVQKKVGAQWRTFPLRVFVEAVLSQLKELGAAELFTDPTAGRLTELTGRLADVEKRLAASVAKFDADPESPTWAEQVSKWDREKRFLAKELAEARMEAANPVSGSWAEAVALMAEDDPDRLRAALLATVEGVWVVIVRRGYNHLAALQVWFRGGARRDYLILFRQGHGSHRSNQGLVPAWPARWWALSLADVTDAGALDLRRRDHARRLERVLAEMELPTEMADGNGDS
jgi:DNA invertase Pin-like site-specific DNA recombinase